MPDAGASAHRDQSKMPTMDEGELTRLVENSAAETRRHFDVVADEVRKDARQVGEETRRHFDVITEGLKREVQLVAEGFAQQGARLDREVGDLREEMKRGFVETQAMIKFSYAELDRRVTLLETSFTRLERLEGRVQDLESRQ
jgi:methyl-accepting chemotaxis protein